MNDDLTWRLDVAVIEWLIVLAMLVILAVVATPQVSKSCYPRVQHAEPPAEATRRAAADGFGIQLHELGM